MATSDDASGTYLVANGASPWYESVMALPSFNEHDGHAKLSPLAGPEAPRATIASWLEGVARSRDRHGIRVLDVGCGRGGFVAWLVEQGFDAYGFDIRPDYIENGRAYLGSDRLAVLEGLAYPYPDSFFDVVVSDQVLEHVADLEQLAREVARVTKPGGVGLHVFPAKWVIKEPHLLTPCVHWLPKGKMRRGALWLALKTGNAAAYFSEYPLSDRTRIFAEYSEQETYYRRPAAIAKTMERAGLVVDFRKISREQVEEKLGRRLRFPADRVAGWAYRTFRSMYVVTEKPLGAEQSI